MEMVMVKLLIWTLVVMNSWKDVQGPQGNKEYIICGANTLQRIYYNTSSNFSRYHNGLRAIDSNPDTSWISDCSHKAQWLEIDFGTKRIMNKIVVVPGKKDGYWTIKYFVLQFYHEDKWFNFSRINLHYENKDTGFFSRIFGKKQYRKKVEIDLGGVDASRYRIFIPDDALVNDCVAIAEVETYIGKNRLKYFDERLKGLYLPIKNGFLPIDDYGYPNAPRNYRGGRHAGLDIYYYYKDKSYKPVLVDFTTPVYAAQDGFVIRADWKYTTMNPDEWKNQSNYYQVNPRTFVMRSFGGRQVWLDHENGVVTTYNHLSRIDPGIKKGTRVKKGQRIGWVGNSGLYGEAAGKSYGAHLHFEIWVDGFFLGYGMDIKDVRKYFSWIFSVSDQGG